jgi:hypothetical protein
LSNPSIKSLPFLLELGMLAAMGRWGYLQGKTTLSKYGIALPLIAVVVVLWSYFAAPKSHNRLNLGYKIIFDCILFLTAAIMLYKSGFTYYGILFGIIATLNLGFAYYFG